jgi:transposase
MWKWYIKLTQAGSAFRTVKSDLGLRPIFYHKENRVQAHILVCFPALALWRKLEQWMNSEGLGTCVRQLVKEESGIKCVVVVVSLRRAEITTELRLQVVTTPEPATAQLRAHLGLRLPKGSPKSVM